MENWTITPLGHYSTQARRAFGAYTAIAIASPSGSAWRIEVGGTEIARATAPLGAKTIEQAITVATAQIRALVDALAPLSALAAEVAHADEVIASTRALLEESKATIARQEARITLLEAKTAADADAAQIRLLNRYVRRAEMAVMGPEDADEEGGQ